MRRGKYHPNSKHERNKEIYELRKSGKTLKEIAEIYKITHARVRVICIQEEFASDELEETKPGLEFWNHTDCC